MEKIALIGKPNSGKSSLFNLLTGLNQKIANYSGATVERKSGIVKGKEIIDLPGIRSLRTITADEEITKSTLLDYTQLGRPVVFVLNGMQLEDGLLLFSEIADLQIPCILVINFKDDLDKVGIRLDLVKMRKMIACPVILMNSRDGSGLSDLQNAIESNSFSIPNAVCRSLYDQWDGDQVENKYTERIASFAICETQIDQDDHFKRQKTISSLVRTVRTRSELNEDILNKSKRWDKFLLHPFFGLLSFLFTIWIIFQSVFYLSSIPMDWIDQFFLFLSETSRVKLGESWLSNLIVDGVIPGLGGVLIFIPQIAILFFLLGFLEHSGYLSRISFISHRFLKIFGLSGQSVIPMMSSWACAIPAIMSTRVISNPKERMAVIMASPLMTCSARLPVYTILISLLHPEEGSGFFNSQGLMLMLMYLIGVVATLVVAWIVNKRSQEQSSSYWSLELPIYRIPNWRNVFYNTYQKTKSFVIDAGKVIFVVSIVLWFLASHSPKDQQFITEKYDQIKIENPDISKEAIDLEYSYAGYLGKAFEPIIEPLGYDWKMGIAIISSFAAREVFVGSLATIYSIGSEEDDLIKNKMAKEINFKTGEKRYNRATIWSLLIFYAFALQCMSTLAIVKRETGSWKYPMIQFILMFVMAYLGAFGMYHLM